MSGYDFFIVETSREERGDREVRGGNPRFDLVRSRIEAMVFYFKARPDAGDYTIFMGLDKFENEELIKYGFPEDVW